MGVIYFLVCVRRYESNLLWIFAWQWGRKHNNTEKNVAFWVKLHSYLILWQHGVFSFTKVCIFLPMVFIRTFITTLCFHDFCKTVLVKKCTPCQGVVWFFPSKCHIFYTGFSVVLYKLTHMKPPEASEQAAKKVEGAALELPSGLTRPGPCEPKFWKNDLPANLFLLCVLPQKHNEFTPAFQHMSCINTHFDMFFKN